MIPSLPLVRENDEEKFIGIYNFSENDKVAWINEDDGMYTDLISGRETRSQRSADSCIRMLSGCAEINNNF